MPVGTGLSDIPWAAVLILLPLAGAIACLLWPAASKALGLITMSAVAVSVAGLVWQLLSWGVYRHAVGGWDTPLGIGLYVDGLSLIMLVATALVGLGISVYATGYFDHQRAAKFWPLWLLLLTALNALFVAADLFNLYVTLELMGLAAVALAASRGDREALRGAMRYLLATLLGSLAYLFGVVFLYHGFGSLDIATLAGRVAGSPPVWAAAGLMSAGLALKSALFPLHFWLPPAHASAPTPVSALLSALVVIAPVYILMRLWLEIFGPLGPRLDELFGLLGAAAILWGSLQALRQSRVKLLVAYSTVAQVGYLYLAFSLSKAMGVTAFSAAAYLMLSHALAKTAMFLAAGNLLHFGGHDRVTDLDRVAQRLPLTVGAFALAGVSIMGLPPSGGFVAKWLLVQAAISQGRWDLATVMILGGLLAAAYVFKVLGYAFTQADGSDQPRTVSASMEWSAMLLACGAILLGFIAADVLSLVRIGAPFATGEAMP